MDERLAETGFDRVLAVMLASPSSGPSDTPRRWFGQEVFHPRVSQAVLRHVILTFLLVAGVNAVLNFSLLHPWVWLTHTLGGILWPSAWLYVLLIGLSALLLGWLVHRHVSVAPSVPQSTLSVVLAVVEVPILLSFLVHVSMGALLSRSLIGLWATTYNSLTRPCLDGSEFKCIDESHILLVQSGAFMAAFLWYGFHFKNGNLLYFPPIRQQGASRLRANIAGVFKTSFLEVLLNMRWFCLFYIVYGHRLAITVSQLSRLNLLHGHDSVFRYLWHQMFVLAYCLFIDTFVVATLKLGMEIHSISLMNPQAFPVTKVDQTPTLATALKTKEPVLLQYLAYMDFKGLSSHNCPRRRELFQLSQPGGHPRNWLEVSSACIQEIEDFMSNLQNSTQIPNANAKPKDHVKPQQANNLRFRFSTDKKFPSETTPDISSTDKSLSKLTTLTSRLWDRIVQRFSRNRLFAQNPELSTRNAFAQSQIVIWAVEGLSQMAEASVMEDEFGVVQRNLAEILTVLISLQQTVERFKGLSVNLKQASNKIRDIQLKQELRSTIKTSIYRITNAYGPHISAVQVPKEIQQRLDHYQKYLE